MIALRIAAYVHPLFGTVRMNAIHRYIHIRLHLTKTKLKKQPDVVDGGNVTMLLNYWNNSIDFLTFSKVFNDRPESPLSICVLKCHQPKLLYYVEL